MKYDLRCKRCGGLFPSIYHFTVTGICNKCFGALPEAERNEMIVNDPIYQSQTQSPTSAGTSKASCTRPRNKALTFWELTLLFTFALGGVCIYLIEGSKATQNSTLLQGICITLLVMTISLYIFSFYKIATLKNQSPALTLLAFFQLLGIAIILFINTKEPSSPSTPRA